MGHPAWPCCKCWLPRYRLRPSGNTRVSRLTSWWLSQACSPLSPLGSSSRRSPCPSNLPNNSWTLSQASWSASHKLSQLTGCLNVHFSGGCFWCFIKEVIRVPTRVHRLFPVVIKQFYPLPHSHQLWTHSQVDEDRMLSGEQTLTPLKKSPGIRS